MSGLLFNSFPLAIMGLSSKLLYASRDGKLTLDETVAAITDTSLGKGRSKIIDTIRVAAVDGNLTILEILNIVTTIVAEFSQTREGDIESEE